MHVANQFNAFSENLPATADAKSMDADYFAMMCHEIGTPLSSIVGLSHILSDVACSEQKKMECAQMLRDSSSMLMSLFRNMLDSAKINAGMFEMENIPFDLARVVEGTVHIMAIKALEKDLDLQMHISETVAPHWIGDPLRIRQILLNLLSNAIKFTEKGQVSLYVNTKRDKQGREQLCIIVADTGIGMKEEVLEKIWGKYAQANTSIPRQHGGTGLGLSISQELARLMHGNIAVKSWPGIGSHFIVTLPLQKTSALLALA